MAPGAHTDLGMRSIGGTSFCGAVQPIAKLSQHTPLYPAADASAVDGNLGGVLPHSTGSMVASSGPTTVPSAAGSTGQEDLIVANGSQIGTLADDGSSPAPPAAPPLPLLAPRLVKHGLSTHRT